jgi:thermostable 8-oxoguanine DNA glycosylase
MYQRDCTMIAQYALASPQGLYDVIEFTLCTINMPISRVHLQRQSIKEEGTQSKWVSATKANGINYAKMNQAYLHKQILHIRDKYGLDTIDGSQYAIDLFIKIPSIGMVKAGFIAQMCGFNVACLDRHNVRALGMSETALNLNKKVSDELRLKKIREYVKLCRRRGSEYWWDTWCNYVADRGGMNKSLPTGDAVSRYHVTAIMEM